MSDDFELDLNEAAKPTKKPKTTNAVVVELDEKKPALDEMPLPHVLTACEEVAAQKVVTVTTIQFDDAIEPTALVNQRTGRKAVIEAVTKLLMVTDLLDLQRIKETKSYKGAQVVVDGKLVTVTTWGDFCVEVEGRSRESVDLEIANLDALGHPTFEALRKIGIGPSTMRSIRQLPEDDRDVVEQAAKTSNKDELIDLIDGLVSKHQKEKSTLEAKAKLLEADIDDERKRRDRIEKTLNDTESRLETTELTLKMATRGEGLALVTRNIRSESMANASLIGYACDEITRQWELAENEAALNDADKTARERAVLMAISAALEAVTMMYESISSRTQIEMPLLPEAFDDLTQAERQATVHSYERVKEQFELVKIKRKSEDYADHVADGGEKKRGRPAGSKNKDA